MSAFMVTDECMNRVLQSFDGLAARTTDPLYPYSTIEAIEQLGRELYAMNSRAMNERYGDPAETPEDFAGLSYKQLPSTSKTERYKAVCCLIYQCSEGTVPEEPLYKKLTERRDQLAREIVGETPAFKAARWDD